MQGRKSQINDQLDGNLHVTEGILIVPMNIRPDDGSHSTIFGALVRALTNPLGRAIFGFCAPLSALWNLASGFRKVKSQFAHPSSRFSTSLINLHCRPVLTMSVTPKENTSTLPPTGEEHPAAITKTLEGEAALYKPILAATRDLSHRFPREHISKALLLIEIEDLAQKELDKIRDDIDKKVKPWDLDRYHRNVLLTPSWTAVPDTPDAFFSRHAGTKPRLILRLAGKAIISKVTKLLSTPWLCLELISKLNDLALHEQIRGYIDRWEARNIETEVAEQAQKQRKRQKKRQQG